MSKLWHDDIRRPPDESWSWARTNAEAVTFIAMHRPDEISLDHDLGLQDHDPDVDDADMQISQNAALEPDGDDLVNTLIELDIVPPKVTIHSWNPIGADRMASKLRQFDPECDVAVEPFDPDSRA